MSRMGKIALAIGGCAAWSALAGCGLTWNGEVEPEARVPLTGIDEDRPVPEDAAEQVETLTERRDRYDEDGDGFVSREEAEGYYRRHFALLDDNNDGRLSRAELRKFNLRADRTINMMPTTDFDELVSSPDAAISTPRPETSVPSAAAGQRPARPRSAGSRDRLPARRRGAHARESAAWRPENRRPD